jgi:hypothetical protein
VDVTITIHRFITLTQADKDRAEAEGLKVTQGIGSLFIKGDLAKAAVFATRFTYDVEETR